MRFFLCLVFCAVASAVPYIIPSRRHQDHATTRIPASRDAQALASTLFTLVASSETGCATTVYHGEIHDIEEGESLDVEGVFKFDDIKVNGQSCGTGEEDEITKLYGNHVLDTTLAGGNVLNLSAVASRSISVGGADMAVRKCGSWEEEYEQSYAFSQDIQRMLPSLSDNGFLNSSSIPQDLLFDIGMWMISAPKDSRGRVCLYKQELDTEEEGEEVVPTITPDDEKIEVVEETSESEDVSLSTDEPSTEDNSTTEISQATPPSDSVSDTSEAEGTSEPESSGIFGDANKEALALEEQEGTEDGSCFPASAQVHLEDGTIKTMKELRIGERVMVAPREFSEVFMFTHKLEQGDYKFIRLETDSGMRLSVTAGHFIYINGKSVTAGTASVGDIVELANGTTAAITSISTVRERGLYNPQTSHGDIMVNEIRASTYTSAVSPSVAHALLVPLRVLYSQFSAYTSSFERGAGSFACLISKRQSA